MNQNNIQGVRQVTPEEVAKVEGVPLTKEELQKTQVLNLKEFSEAVRWEKLTSKKPAMIIAIIGAVFILFGTSFQITKSIRASRKSDVEPRYVPEQKPQEEPVQEKESLTCTSTTLNNADGTDVIYTIVYDFEKDKLVGFTKSYSVSVTPGSAEGEATVQKGIAEIQPLVAKIDGYQLTLTPTTNGYVATTTANYLTLDLRRVSEAHQNHFLSKIDYPLDTNRDKINESMTSFGYKCE